VSVPVLVSGKSTRSVPALPSPAGRVRLRRASTIVLVLVLVLDLVLVLVFPPHRGGSTRSKCLRPKAKGARKLSPGFTPGYSNRRFALKGLEMRTRSDSEVPRSRFSLTLLAPSGLMRMGVSQGKPWAKLSWPLRATDWNVQITEPLRGTS
jgi:hypothetical protein